MLNQRRKLLAYLRRDNFPRYAFVLHKLGLKDTYAKQVGKQGTAAWSAAAGPAGL
jgi:ribosomal protein S15P/S13E